MEEEATEILRMDKAVDRNNQAGSWHGILAPDQLELRAFREIPMDPHLFDVGLTPGLYRRAWADWAKRPHKWWNQVDDPAFDARVGMAQPHTGFYGDLLAFRDPEWPTPAPHHLDRFQRCRIRRALRDVPPGQTRLRSLTRWLLAAKYGVTIHDVLELEGL